jgi:mono/diheme cytochrome c family protein
LDPIWVAEGEVLYTQHCTSCHSGSRSGT